MERTVKVKVIGFLIVLFVVVMPVPVCGGRLSYGDAIKPVIGEAWSMAPVPVPDFVLVPAPAPEVVPTPVSEAVPTPAATPAPTPEVVATATTTVLVTFYSCSQACGDPAGPLPLAEGQAACDPAYMGRSFALNGHTYICNDTGSLVHGAHVDLFFWEEDRGWAYLAQYGTTGALTWLD